MRIDAFAVRAQEFMYADCATTISFAKIAGLKFIPHYLKM